MDATPVPDASANMLYTIVMNFLALSLVSERISNLIKLTFENTRKKKYSLEEEKLRERSVLWITIGCGILVSILAGADFFALVKGLPLKNTFACDTWTNDAEPDDLVKTMYMWPGYILFMIAY